MMWKRSCALVVIGAALACAVEGGCVSKEKEVAAQPEDDRHPRPLMKDRIILDMTISGLCAFVKEVKNGGTCYKDPTLFAHIFMMKGFMMHNGREVEVPHTPRLLVESRYSAKNKCTEIIALPNGRQVLVWDLTGYRLELPDVPIGIWKDRRRNEQQLLPDDGRHPDAPDDSFTWVPELHRACEVEPSELTFKPHVFEDDKLFGDALARIKAIRVTDTPDDGWLDAEIDDAWKSSVFTFNDKYKQVLSDRARLRMNLDGQSVTLKLVPYDANKTAIDITLRPPADDDVVRIFLSNLPTEQEAHLPNEPLEHFRSYFHLIYENDKTKCAVPSYISTKAAEPVKCTLCSTCGPHP